MQNVETKTAINEEDQPLTYAWYMVFLCTVAYIFSFIDRQIVVLLIEPIRADLQISDTQFSLIHGLAFALFYATMGLPIARLADNRSRPLIISTGIFIWSLATAMCGVTRNFWELFIARMGVGVGEAALSPAAYSMITDSFPKSKLGLALGVYSTGVFLGSGLAFLIGGTVIGYISDYGIVELPLLGVIKPWQLTFFIVGIPGIVIAMLFYMTIRDPERKGIANNSGFSIREIGAYIALHKKTFASHYLGFGFSSLSMFALMSWAPAFLIRNYGLEIQQVGIYLGALVLVCNTGGVLCSGTLIDVFTRRGYTDAAMRAGVVGAVGAILPAAIFCFMPGLYSALAMLAVAMFFTSFPVATSAAALQVMAPNQMRAQVTALFFLSMNILGITGGATLVALCTDYVFRDDVMVGYSMSLISSSSAFVGALLLFWGLKHFTVTALAVNPEK